MQTPEKSDKAPQKNQESDSASTASSSPVCYADSHEIRPEYRLDITAVPPKTPQTQVEKSSESTTG